VIPDYAGDDEVHFLLVRGGEGEGVVEEQGVPHRAVDDAVEDVG
jgi:7-keto-8-aminopelargonate synthetase-like enzyme